MNLIDAFTLGNIVLVLFAKAFLSELLDYHDCSLPCDKLNYLASRDCLKHRYDLEIKKETNLSVVFYLTPLSFSPLKKKNDTFIFWSTLTLDHLPLLPLITYFYDDKNVMGVMCKITNSILLKCVKSKSFFFKLCV